MGKHHKTKGNSEAESETKKEDGMDLFSLFKNMNIIDTLNLESIKEMLNKTESKDLIETINKYNIFVTNNNRSSDVDAKSEIFDSLKTLLNTDRKVLLETMMQLYFASRFNEDKNT